MNNARFIIQVSKGLIRHQRARRLLMFYSVLVALVLLFAGATLLWPLQHEHPLIFLAYWAVCLWITLLSVLLALYDLVKVRADVRRARRELERDPLAKRAAQPDDEDPR